MKIYRISKKKYINDLTGFGAKINGGRWNKVGTSVVYTSESRALASMEYLVHVPITDIPKNLKIVTINAPDDIEDISISDLPSNWRDDPPPYELARLGTNWALSGRSLLLRVPSAVVLDEYNILLNSSHAKMKNVKIESIDDFCYDDRVAK